MAYQMIHMEVAYRLLDKFDWIQEPADYMMGSIAPDSVHFYPEYNVHLKECSHLWNYGPRWGITVESEKWQANILDFWNMHKNDENKDFIAGYCVHVLTDRFNDLILWQPFREMVQSGAAYEDIYKIYAKEAIGSDRWLYQNSKNSPCIMELLAQSRTYSIPGCILKEEVDCQKQHILTAQYANLTPADTRDYRYCTEESILSFIDTCVNEISQIM